MTKHGRMFEAKTLIVATGFSKESIPNIPNVHLCETYATYDKTPKGFENKKVLIVGTGNSGFEVATSLLDQAADMHVLSPKPMRPASHTHYVGDVRILNMKAVENYQLKSQSTVVTGTIESLKKVGDKYAVGIYFANAALSEHRETLLYDRVIICTGFKFDTSIYDESCRPLMCPKGKYPLQDHEWQSTNVPGLYFAGTTTHIHDYRVAASGFIHGFRYNCKALHIMLRHKYEGVPIPRQILPQDPRSLANLMIERFNTSDGLYLQTGTMVEAFVLKGDKVERITDLSSFYFRGSPHFKSEDILLISLEYGDFSQANIYAITRIIG